MCSWVKVLPPNPNAVFIFTDSLMLSSKQLVDSAWLCGVLKRISVSFTHHTWNDLRKKINYCLYYANIALKHACWYVRDSGNELNKWCSVFMARISSKWCSLISMKKSIYQSKYNSMELNLYNWYAWVSSFVLECYLIWALKCFGITKIVESHVHLHQILATLCYECGGQGKLDKCGALQAGLSDNKR